MALSAGQQEAFDKVIDLLRQGHKRIILKGAAGTGKTYLSGEIIKFVSRDRTINPNYNSGKVFVTAPTNKALAVIMGKVDARVEFKTIHSACRLKRIVTKQGQELYIKSTYVNKNEENFDKAKAAFIDECSMLGILFMGGIDKNKENVKGLLEDYPFPIIFIGDPFQINPVGELNSPVFEKGYPEVVLTEIIRQGAGNPIIDLSRDLDMIYFKSPRIIDARGYLYNDNKPMLIDDLAEANGCDDLKYLAFTNQEVDTMNRLVRERIYGTPKKVERYETLVFNSPYEGFYTNQEVKVQDLEIITDNVPVPMYKTKFDSSAKPIDSVQYVKMKFYRINNSFNIIHEHSEQVFNTISLTLKSNHQKFGWDGRGHHFFKDQFADVKYNHALSIHKSQGSTYKEAILNVGNVNFNPNAIERQRLLYTGVTRASHLLILNNVK